MATSMEFEKLLADAPLAPDADSVTVFGTLARTADPGHFSFTLTDGRTAKLSVHAVKSSKVLAGAIGQSIVELELDAKLVPDDFRELIRNFGPFGPTIGVNEYISVPGTEQSVAHPEHVGSFPALETIAEFGLTPAGPVHAGSVATSNGAAAPFVAAMPHQAPQTTIDAFRQALVIKPLWADPTSAPSFEVTHPAAIYHLARDYSY